MDQGTFGKHPRVSARFFLPGEYITNAGNKQEHTLYCASPQDPLTVGSFTVFFF